MSWEASQAVAENLKRASTLHFSNWISFFLHLHDFYAATRIGHCFLSIFCILWGCWYPFCFSCLMDIIVHNAKLHCVAFSFLVCKGSAMEPCSKNHCSSFRSWGVYSCDYIYSVNRGTLLLKNLSHPPRKRSFMKYVSLRYSYLFLIDCL